MSTTDQTVPQGPGTPRRRWWVIGLAGLLVVAVVAALAVTVVAPRMAEAERRDRVVKAFASAAERDLGGYSVDSRGTLGGYTSGGYGAGDVQAFGNPRGMELQLLVSQTVLARADDFTPERLWDLIGERDERCPDRAVGAQVRLKRVEETVTLVGCLADTNTASHLSIWRGDRQLDTTFSSWFSPEGLGFLREFALDGATTDKLYRLELTRTRATIAWASPTPGTCPATRWTWYLDDDGLSLGGTACEEPTKSSGIGEALTEDDLAPFPSVGDWDPGDTLAAIEKALDDTELNELDSANLRSSGPDGNVPALELVASGRQAIVPLSTALQADLDVADPLPTVTGKPWPASADGWRIAPGTAEPVGRGTATYALGGQSATVRLLPQEPLPADWYGWLVKQYQPTTALGEATCGVPYVRGLSLSASCMVRVDGGVLLAQRVTDPDAPIPDDEDLDLEPLSGLVDALTEQLR